MKGGLNKNDNPHRSGAKRISQLLANNEFSQGPKWSEMPKTPIERTNLIKLSKSILSESSIENKVENRSSKSKTTPSINQLSGILSKRESSDGLYRPDKERVSAIGIIKREGVLASPPLPNLHKVSSAKQYFSTPHESTDNLFQSKNLKTPNLNTTTIIIEKMKSSSNLFIKELVNSKTRNLPSRTDKKNMSTLVIPASDETGASQISPIKKSGESFVIDTSKFKHRISSVRQSRPQAGSLSPSIESNQRIYGTTAELHLKLNSLNARLEHKIEKCFDKIIRAAKDLKREILSGVKKSVEDGIRAASEGNDIDIEFNIKMLASRSSISQTLMSLLQDEIVKVRIEKDRLLCTDRRTNDFGINITDERQNSDTIKGQVPKNYQSREREETSFTKFFENTKVSDFIDNVDPYTYFNNKRAANESLKTDMFQQTFK